MTSPVRRVCKSGRRSSGLQKSAGKSKDDAESQAECSSNRETACKKVDKNSHPRRHQPGRHNGMNGRRRKTPIYEYLPEGAAIVRFPHVGRLERGDAVALLGE